jgi:hypothetical protein
MTGIFQSRIVRGLAQPLLSAGATATAVCLYEALLQVGGGLGARPACMAAVEWAGPGKGQATLPAHARMHLAALTGTAAHR